MAFSFKLKKNSNRHINSINVPIRTKPSSPWNSKTIIGIIITLLSIAYTAQTIFGIGAGIIMPLLVLSSLVGGITFIVSLFKMRIKQEKYQPQPVETSFTLPLTNPPLTSNSTTNDSQNRSDTHRKEKKEDYAMRRSKKIFRSVKDKRILGVCGGIADYFGISAMIVRIVLILLVIASYSSVIVFYFIFGIFVLEKNPYELEKEK